MPDNPTLPPSLGAMFRGFEERLAALERGGKSLNYRQLLTTNDAANARELHMEQAGTTWTPKDHEVYAISLTNPRYPVMVARFHLILIQGCAAEVWLTSTMGAASRNTQRWQVTGGTGAAGTSVWSQFEVAWLHGMPTDQWSDTDAQRVLKRGNIELHVNVKQQSTRYERNPDFSADALSKGFTAAQTQFLDFWLAKSSNRNPVFAREPEYVFLAPLGAFPTASAEGTMITGASVPGYPVPAMASGTASVLSDGGNQAESAVWTGEPGDWPVRLPHEVT
ncbi:hypothetical protein [Actinosynnema sp. NPDC020468]|uniref:hypothetical protein n=1 Tax=Actinosynnema sp. NPDC020468 TaxID=3154488 RepID=UPI0033C7351B